LGVEVFAGPSGFGADDSVQLISTAMYRQFVLPLHRKWYALWSEKGPHSIHLCGDASRHFPIIHEELNVCSFDTGYPVDHGRLRRELGNDVTIYGGPEVALLLNGTPQKVRERTKAILQSGIMEGGKFVLHEANNLPPRCPEENLRSMYECCLEYGRYS
jgi:uroporphyrinogen-III decarboxylase